MTTPVVRLGSPVEIAASVPSLLGFTPDPHSLVLVTMTGRLLGMTCRVDIPTPDQTPALLFRLAHAVARQQDVTDVHVIGWGVDPMVTTLLHGLLGSLDMPVRECLTVNDGQVMDTCSDVTDPVWEPLPMDPVAPAAVFAGIVRRGSRTELEQLVAITGIAYPQMALTDAEMDLATRLTTTTTRDELLTDLATADPDRLRTTLDVYLKIAREFPDANYRRKGALCLAATCAYLLGDGALANVALDAVTGVYPLANLLRRFLEIAIPPAELREVLAQTAH